MAAGLCQPGGGASCGACCGLYNFADHSREALTAALRRRTEAIRQRPRTLADYRRCAGELRAAEQEPLFGDVRVCPVLGFLDEAERQVGCLAHPRVTGGEDLRDCGVYNANTCATFECPSFLWLSDEEAALVRDACADWYLYGLVITDVEFVRGCLRLISDAVAAPVSASRLHSAALPQVAALFALKANAPRRRPGAKVFGRFVPDGSGDGALRTLDYRRLATRPAPEDDVVLCLGYAPETAAQLEDARSIVRDHVLAIVACLSSQR